FDPTAFEPKWQTQWESDKVFAPDLEHATKPYMNLMMFPYPSAEGLHVGNMYAQTGADVYGRFKRMQGYDVFEPMGLDGFGIHSENYALKVGVHPIKQAKITQERFYKQMKAIGTSVDWSRTLETYDPLYYRWTQWLFIKLFKAGLAYRKKAEVNFCPKDLTVLSDEQVIDGKCERCGSIVEKRELEQWFFRITNYAERLLNNIEGLDWTEKVKIAQKNWIGKKTGAVITFPIDGKDYKIDVFTTRPDTLYGATFLVVAPEHPFAQEAQSSEVKEYIKLAKSKSNIERTSEGKEKTGVFSGFYAINPVSKEKLPVWVADYVLMGYGTGAIMAVPAHDARDFEFAKKYELPMVEVIKGKDSNIQEGAYVDDGIIINSGEWNGLNMPRDLSKIIASLEKKGLGARQDNYHLRDWLISRQRYWGPPIPMVYCEKCAETGKGEQKDMPGWYAVSETDLPVLLPDVADWKPMGAGLSPLANHPEFYSVACPECGEAARRETDVSDTFLDSAWYFLGYISDVITAKSKNRESISRGIKIDQNLDAPWTKNVQKKWLPVKKYIGGAEHSVLHLLYARFISMVLADLKLIDFEEPFSSFFAHGLIIKDGAKMSKSKGNVVVPDTYIEKYGADTLRVYLMFLGPFSDGGDFRDSGIEGMGRFLKRIWVLFQNQISNDKFQISNELSNEANFQMHKTIKKVTEDIEAFKYNTAISGIMEWYNFLSKQDQISKIETETFLKLLAPLAPYMTEELWQRQNSKLETQDSKLNSIHLEPWPTWDEKYLVSNEATIVVQVNGKKRSEFVIDTSKLNDEEKIKAEAKLLIEKYLEGKEPKKTIYVPGKIVNFVV
ncbi:MAG: leucine--tRNA ligase, partial [Candidatus Levyibacteriota bacterium]